MLNVVSIRLLKLNVFLQSLFNAHKYFISVRLRVILNYLVLLVSVLLSNELYSSGCCTFCMNCQKLQKKNKSQNPFELVVFFFLCIESQQEE